MQVEIESPRATRSNETPKKEPIRERSNLTDFELEPKVPKEEVKEMIREVKRESKSPAPIYFDDKNRDRLREVIKSLNENKSSSAASEYIDNFFSQKNSQYLFSLVSGILQ